jgi:pimeloyl-ACP methyl ester carboxylesterase
VNDTELRPHVVIIGGFLTEGFMYAPMRQRLLAAGAARVTIAPVHLPDWVALVFGSMGPLLLRGARAIREARALSPEPVMVVGHSLGGIIARLAICDVPLDGRRAAVAHDVGCLVTLGTPYRFDPRLPWRHAAVRAAAHLSEACPPGRFAPVTGYLTVGARSVPPAGRSPLRSWAQGFNRVLRGLVGETPGVPGDGLIGSDRCRLDDVRHVEFDDILHGLFYGPWYGDTQAIERWWPVAVEEWRRALAAREQADVPATEAAA